MSPSVQELRAAALGRSWREQGPPAGAARMQPFQAQLRAETVDWQGKARARLEGYASVVDIPYEMYDFFGPYQETIAAGAFDETLAADPDVAFLLNHRGMTMARTTNSSLELWADPRGLGSRAFVNPDRSDVKDLLHAIDDDHITEMSFAFMIEDAEWNDDFDEFTITKVDLDRGDVSAVNYGANPYTSIGARSREIINSLDHLPAGAARAAIQRLEARSDIAAERAAQLTAERAVAVAEVRTRLAELPQGRSTSLAHNEFLAVWAD